jgi:hypothetical protein
MVREDAVSGVTSNPTIFQIALSSGDAYDDQLRDLIATENDPKEIFIQLAAPIHAGRTDPPRDSSSPTREDAGLRELVPFA